MAQFELAGEHNALDLKKFGWDAGRRVLSACDSDLRTERFNGSYKFLTQLYNDACDVGCQIRSHVTGKMEKFVWDESKGKNRDFSFGYSAFYFKPVDPKSKVKEVVIFND